MGIKANGVALIQFEEEVLEVLNEKTNPHQKHLKLKEYMTSPQWSQNSSSLHFWDDTLKLSLKTSSETIV